MAIVHVVESRGDADFTIFDVGSRAAADLMVCKVDSRGDALRDDQFWCFVDSRADASSNVYLNDGRAGTDLLICYVESRGDAGWRNNDHPLKGKL